VCPVRTVLPVGVGAICAWSLRTTCPHHLQNFVKDISHAKSCVSVVHLDDYPVFRFRVQYVNKCSAVAEMGDLLATIDAGRKWGLRALFGDLDPHVTHMWSWPRPFLRTKWHLDPYSRLATTDMAENWGGCDPFWEGSWVPI